MDNFDTNFYVYIVIKVPSGLPNTLNIQSAMLHNNNKLITQVPLKNLIKLDKSRF